MKEIKKANGVEFFFDEEYGINMKNPKTIKKYTQINEKYQKMPFPAGMFCFFSNEQYEQAKKEQLKLGVDVEKEKIYRIGAGVYGTAKAIKAYEKRVEARCEEMRQCNPQEVYFYEYNNYEAMYNYDGDEDAVKTVINIFGKDVAKTLKRYRVVYTLEEIINEMEGEK